MALPLIAPSLAEDTVVDVVAARSTRVVLLTNRHLAYILARRHVSSGAAAAAAAAAGGDGAGDGVTVTYRVKWVLRNENVDNIRGMDRGYNINVEYHLPMR